MGDGMGWVGLGWGGRRGQESWDGWVGSGVGVRCWGGGPRSSKCMKAKPRVCVLWVGGGGGAIHTSGRSVLQAWRARPFCASRTPETVCLMDLKGWHAW